MATKAIPMLINAWIILWVKSKSWRPTPTNHAHIFCFTLEIYLARGEERSGPYSEERVRSLLSQGQLDGNELAWHEGRTDWMAIREILNNLPSSEKPPATVPARKPSVDTQMPREQSRKESNTQKVPRSSQDKWDIFILPYFAVFCLSIITGLVGLVIYLIWSAIRPA